MRNSDRATLALLSTALGGKKAEPSEDFDAEAAFSLCRRHGMLPLLSEGLSANGICLSNSAEGTLRRSAAVCVAVGMKQSAAAEELRNAFLRAGISFMPLKGISVREKYPSPVYRMMGDIDFLVKERESEKAGELLSELGFVFIRNGDRQSVWSRDTVMVELHTGLVSETSADFAEYWRNAWERAHKVNGSCEHRFSPEDEYCYLVTHIAKHFRNGGIGLRQIADIYVYKKACPELDTAYISAELERLGLSVFYGTLLRLEALLFEGAEEENETVQGAADYVLRCPFATHKSASASKGLRELAEGTGEPRLKKLFKAAFLPYREMCGLYGILKGLPFLLPVLWVVRGVDRCFIHRDSARLTVRAIMASGGAELAAQREFLNSVGLDTSFGKGAGSH